MANNLNTCCVLLPALGDQGFRGVVSGDSLAVWINAYMLYKILKYSLSQGFPKSEMGFAKASTIDSA